MLKTRVCTISPNNGPTAGGSFRSASFFTSAGNHLPDPSAISAREAKLKGRKPRSNGTEQARPSDNNVTQTTGEFFADGSAIDVVRGASGELALLHWNGQVARMVPHVEYATRLYRPAALDPSIGRVVRLPRSSVPCGNSKELLLDISKVLTAYLQLPSNFITMATAFSAASWFAINRESAPWLAITGRNYTAARQLTRLLGCICRRALLLSDITMSGICSLPLEWGFTLQISQNPASPDLYRLLNASHERRSRVVHCGRLIQLYAPVVTCSSAPIVSSELALAPIEIHATPSNIMLPPLDLEVEERIAEEYQPKLLGYLFENHKKTENYDTDLSSLDASLRGAASTLTASLPHDAEFRAQTIDALKMQYAAMRCNRWTDIDVVLVEALLFFIHEGCKEAVYVGEMGNAGEKTLAGRGETLRLAPKNVAARLRDLGLKTEDRDKRGYRYLLTQAFSRQVHELGRALDVPSMQDGQQRCEQCVPVVEDRAGKGCTK